MENFGHIFDDNMDNIKVISNCPICNSKYYSSEAKILAEKNNGHLVHIQCKKCKSSVIALILASGVGVSSISLVTDLTPEDVMKFKDSAPISLDQIVDLHTILTHKKIDLSKL